jgi:hypothetical protein
MWPGRAADALGHTSASSHEIAHRPVANPQSTFQVTATR